MMIPLTKANLDQITNGSKLLEFDVLHAQYEGEQQTQPTLNLMGSIFVDISALALDQSNLKQNFVSGYYHVINRAQVRSSHDLAFLEPNQLSKVSQGQVKVTIRSDRQKASAAEQVSPSRLVNSIGGDNQKSLLSNSMRDTIEPLNMLQGTGQVANPFRGTQTFGNDRMPVASSFVDYRAVRSSQQ